MRNDGNSQRDEILAALKKGERITPLDALARFGVFRLAARISELREDGHHIVSELVERNGKYVAEYWLKRSARAA